MKKILILSVYASFALSAVFTNPLPESNKAIENGGTLSAIDAYKDGVGVAVVTQTRGIDNSAMNTLVFKYGTTAKTNSVSIGDQVLLTGTSADKLLIANLYPDGQSCTISGQTGSTWLNGVCQGGITTIPPLTSITNVSSITQEHIATYNIFGSQDLYGTNNYTWLFNNNNSNYFYFHNTIANNANHYVDIEVNSKFRLWSYTFNYYQYNSAFLFTNVATGIVAQNSVSGTKIDGWNCVSSVIPAGRYRITTTGPSDYNAGVSTRTEYEWFIEKIN